jgi:two-component system sensor histidine kinase BarA
MNSRMQERGVHKKLGIKGRVLMLTLLPTSLMALVLGGYFTWMQQSDLQTQLLKHGEMLTEQLAPLVAPAMGHQDNELLERIATQALEHPDVRAVTFLAPDRTLLATARRCCAAAATMRHVTCFPCSANTAIWRAT